MTPREAVHSLPGHLACAALTLALFGGAAVAFAGPSAASYGLMGLAVATVVVVAVFAVLLATEELVLKAVVVFVPTTLLGVLYVPALFAFRHAGRPAGVILLALALGPIILTLGQAHGSQGEPSSPAGPLDSFPHPAR